jgi:hypothetical protein
VRRPRAVPASAGLVLLLSVLVACAAPGASAGAPGPEASPAATPVLTPFLGIWSRHGAGLTISPDGSFSFEWRTYRMCGQYPPPCDQIVNNVITGGGRAIGTMHAVAARSAGGRVSATTDATFVPAGSFIADVTDYQLLTLRFPSTTLRLCGNEFDRLAPVTVARTQPCGA